MRKFVLSAIMAFAIVPSAAMARPPSGDHTASADPNKVVCRSQEIIGSRLGSIKTCHTAQEWQQVERDERDTVNKIQANKSYQGG